MATPKTDSPITTVVDIVVPFPGTPETKKAELGSPAHDEAASGEGSNHPVVVALLLFSVSWVPVFSHSNRVSLNVMLLGLTVAENTLPT
jgi:hypothetical protein